MFNMKNFTTNASLVDAWDRNSAVFSGLSIIRKQLEAGGWGLQLPQLVEFVSGEGR